jgi:hypothetical protein
MRGGARVHEVRHTTRRARRSSLLKSGDERRVSACLLGGHVGRHAAVGRRIGLLQCSVEGLTSLRTGAEDAGDGGRGTGMV